MIIGISGKKQSGKDTVGKIIQILLNSPQLNNEGVLTFLRKNVVNSDHTYYPYNWHIRKFADKLKDIVCLLIGCTREQLEDEEFKNALLGEEWNCYLDGFSNKLYLDKNDAIHEAFTEWDADERYLEHRVMTPRLMMQLVGTECGRNILHPQIWVNALMSDYVEDMGYKYTVGYDPIHENETEPTGESKAVTITHDYPGKENKTIQVYLSSPPQRFNNGFPNWIITDMRFPNELEAIKERKGFTIRVHRDIALRTKLGDTFNASFPDDNHPSETALDKSKFDYVINNDTDLNDLIDKVREILSMENLLNGYKITNGN